MKPVIQDGTIIYVASPPRYCTGGTEVLQQLVWKLRGLGHDSRIFYTDPTDEDPVHPDFRSYDLPWVKAVEEVERHVLIVPETFTYLLAHHDHLQKVIWWLSIDNYYKVLPRSKPGRWIRAVALPVEKALGIPKRSLPKVHFEIGSPSRGIIHLYQCEYARRHLLAHGLDRDLYRLSDYLNRVFLAEQVDYRAASRRDQVLYNPSKGIEFTRRLMQAAPDLAWKPLEKMTPAQIRTTLEASKVYVDFGNHPGKDRFPREAAISGCCVLTGLKGSAAFAEDVPVPTEYKFDEERTPLEEIVKKIRACLAQYDFRIDDFAPYRQAIRGEEAVFDQDIEALFGRRAGAAEPVRSSDPVDARTAP